MLKKHEIYVLIVLKLTSTGAKSKASNSTIVNRLCSAGALTYLISIAYIMEAIPPSGGANTHTGIIT